MQRLLITGIDNIVGSNLALALADRFDVFGLPTTSPSHWADDCGSAHDVVQLTRAICEARPHRVIHCSQLSINQWDQDSIALSNGADRCEREIAGHLIELTQSIGAQLTAVLSDAVFVGPTTYHNERSTDWASGSLGQRIREVEELCLASDALVVRTHVYGWSPGDSQQSFAERLLGALSDGVEIRADGTRYASPILAADLADLLAQAFSHEISGLVHLSGAERTNQYRFACELASALNVAAPRVSEIAKVAASESETSLRSMRGSEIPGMKLPLLRDGLTRFVEQARADWRKRCGWQTAQAGLQHAA